ncbi:hypothetical protein [Microbacterium sp. 3J1]|uniref:hypothetical protein n=1 Tax=Microbacterium sp. 3J1 TaxID=861269 RepID=UPI000ABDD50D|nr:hypothetical protein [Microbacterium sp. 3J1]
MSSRLRTALGGTLLALALAGCSAPTPTPTPAPSESAPQTPPPAAAVSPAADDPAAVAVEQVQVMSDVWESAGPEQRDEALRVIGLDPADPQPTDETASTLVAKAAELGYVVSEDAAREFLAQIAAR